MAYIQGSRFLVQHLLGFGLLNHLHCVLLRIWIVDSQVWQMADADVDTTIESLKDGNLPVLELPGVYEFLIQIEVAKHQVE